MFALSARFRVLIVGLLTAVTGSVIQARPAAAAEADAQAASRASDAPSDAKVWLGLGGGSALGLGPWLSPAVALTVGQQFESRWYLGAHSALVLGRHENDDPVDRLHHHAVELGYALLGPHLYVVPGLRVGALFFRSGRGSSENFITPTARLGARLHYVISADLPLQFGLDIGLLYVHHPLERGDTSVGLSAIPLIASVGWVL